MARLVFHVDVNSANLSWEAARRVANGEPDLRHVSASIQRGSSMQSKLDAGRKYKAQLELKQDKTDKKGMIRCTSNAPQTPPFPGSEGWRCAFWSC